MTAETSTSKTQFWNRLQMIMIFVVFAAPIIGAFLYKPQKFNNYGDLYTPVRPVSNLVMRGEGGDVVRFVSSTMGFSDNRRLKLL